MISKSIITGALCSSVSAWWNQGHLLTARVAYDILEEKSPQTVKDVTNVLSYLKSSDPNWTVNEDQHPMVECATFGDFIKYKGGSYQKGWHFIDEPYFDEGGDISDFPDFNLEPYNITVAIGGINRWFKDDDTEDNYPYEQITSHGYKDPTVEDNMSTAMRLLIHYVGDSHQPLHGVSRVDNEYPAGDRGGNSFHVQSKFGAKNLHAVWDSVVYSEHSDMKTPLSSSSWSALGDEAAKLRETYSDEDLQNQAKDLDPNNWAAEGLELATKYVYADIKEGELPSAEY